ncbi:hypothetical protein [Maridesulfovibrio salexigens]|uniref:Uncharacterized protein n=1 Tax=Maridesulfovibrio salexigens (strain ATCC 14822 / DSM 2638 / NCIMB 8403 / VKM B-1763) TaxID=526222 RepID=C6BX02_MARSD|nr:hypothetical protein [Maridesulfovibrio salexigens]ACS78482.1 conserved hypothetical protein [Maridesulfovibrio salexigens DSM 2638]
MMENKTLGFRIISFFATCSVIWAMVFVAGPMLIDTTPAFRTLADFVTESDIETGEFYYTDVEIVGHADHNARSSMEYLPHGPGPE